MKSNITCNQLIGYHLRQLRLEQGLTQEQAAEEFSCSVKQWSRYERGEAEISYELLTQIYNLWGIPSVEYFLFANDYDGRKVKERRPRDKNIVRRT